MQYSHSTLTPVDVLRLLWRRPRAWMVSSIAGALAAVAWIFFVPAPWQASQAIVVRNESINSQDSPGRFRQENELRTMLETVAELAKGHGVVTRALRQVGPPPTRKSSETWPSEEEIADTQTAIKIDSPRGVEMGKAEILYIRVKNKNKQRAVALASALYEQLETKISEVRGRKAAGLIEELEKSVKLAEAELDKFTAELKAMEQQVGGRDLADLRMLDQSTNGDSDLRRNLINVDAEIRDAKTAAQTHAEILSNLQEARRNPAQLAVMSNTLLATNPSLRKLKDSLLDAQVRSAHLRSMFTANHPQVKAAILAEQEIQRQIGQELNAAIDGIQTEMRLTAERLKMLEGQTNSADQRLDAMAELRAKYSNVSAAVKHQNTQVERARADLAEARSAEAASLSGSLVSRIDAPSTGPRPAGPRKALILAGGTIGGFLTGVGWLFLSLPGLPPAAPQGGALTTISPYLLRPTVLTVNEPSPVPAPSPERGLSLKQALWKIAHDRPLLPHR